MPFHLMEILMEKRPGPSSGSVDNSAHACQDPINGNRCFIYHPFFSVISYEPGLPFPQIQIHYTPYFPHSISSCIHSSNHLSIYLSLPPSFLPSLHPSLTDIGPSLPPSTIIHPWPYIPPPYISSLHSSIHPSTHPSLYGS